MRTDDHEMLNVSITERLLTVNWRSCKCFGCCNSNFLQNRRHRYMSSSPWKNIHRTVFFQTYEFSNCIYQHGFYLLISRKCCGSIFLISISIYFKINACSFSFSGIYNTNKWFLLTIRIAFIAKLY